jgi:hypothetical protein
MPPTSPEWAAYYKRAKQTHRLGKGQHPEKEAKRRRQRELIIALASTAVLVAVFAICAALLG